MIQEHHCSTEFRHSKYEVNQTTRMTLLSEIDIKESGDCISSIKSKEILTEEKKHINPCVSNTSDWHPVTLLYQLCKDNKLPLPKYLLIDQENSLKKKIFTFEVHAFQNSASGTGFTKRSAKRIASQALLIKLKDESYLEENLCTISSQTSVSERDRELSNTSLQDDCSVSDPICELNNLCSAQKWPFPVYALLSACGPSHNRSFTMGCAILGHPEIGEGTGPTKKEAKRAASLDLLEKINSLKPLDSVACSRGYLCDEESQTNCPEVTENPTSLLNEICICYNWPLPIYEFVSESGPPKRRQYTVGCTLLGHTELGVGYSKKEAKRASSLAILVKIGEYLEDSIPFLNRQSTNRRKKRSNSPYTNIKDATTILHEFCTSQNWPHPSYEMLSEEGETNSRVYTIGCFVMGRTSLVVGSGHSKSEAKHAASQALIDKLKGNKNGIIPYDDIQSTDCICKQEHDNICPYRLQVNATSLLNEMCVCYKWPLPKYEDLPDRISTKRKLYVVGCSLLGNSEIGTGFSKIEAKLAASLAILVKIRSSIEVSFLSPSKGMDLAKRVKDPTAVLHEFCASKGWPYPTYELLPEEGPSNQKCFTMCCIVPGHTEIAQGKGFSKVEAKHMASQAVLDILKQSSMESYQSPKGYMENNMLLPKSKEKVIHKNNKDPISELHELCASQKWPYPSYTVTQEGASNQCYFTISCSVESFTSSVTGSGCSKKEAKREASQALLEKIKQEKNSS